MAKGLYKVHKCGVAHHDLALRNIIITDCDRFSGAVFLDFAFACKADDDSIKGDAERFRLGSTLASISKAKLTFPAFLLVSRGLMLWNTRSRSGMNSNAQNSGVLCSRE
jgi:hypothetical protein